MPLTARSLENYQVELINGAHKWIGDEPKSAGGDDAGPDPYGMMLGALATCKIATVQMYANRKEWPLEGVEITMDYHRELGKDCEDCEAEGSERVDIFTVEISFKGDLDDEQIARLKEISSRCPVHRSLLSETVIRTTVK